MLGFGRGKRRRQAEMVAEYAASPETQWVWTMGDEGPTAIPGRRVPGGINAMGRLYPDYFLEETGRRNYWVGTHFMVPKDGDYSHVGDVPPEDLVEAPAIRVLVWWWQVCAARDQQNLQALLEPANPQGKTLSLVMRSVVIVAAVITMYSTWGMKGEMTRAADTSVQVSGAVERLEGRLNATPVPGAPSGSGSTTIQPAMPVQPAAPTPNAPGEPAATIEQPQSALPTAPPQPECGRDPRLKPDEPTATCVPAAAEEAHNDSVEEEEADGLAKDAKLKPGEERSGEALDRARRQQTPVAGGTD